MVLLKEYDSLYRQESATLAVSEQLMVDAEDYLDKFEEMYFDRDLTSTRWPEVHSGPIQICESRIHCLCDCCSHMLHRETQRSGVFWDCK